MSRSYKKHPWEQWGGCKDYKKLFNRRLRRSEQCKDIPNGKAYKKLNESWNIADYKTNCSFEEFLNWRWVEGAFKDENEAYAAWKKEYGSK